jgi:predicted lipid-binding transport protein (Tim44 family)
MTMQNVDVSTVIFAIVAIFVIFKLRSVLGTRGGPRGRPLEPTRPARAPSPANGNVIPLGSVARGAGTTRPADRWKGFAEPGSALAAGLDAIVAAEPGFTAEGFIAGARGAYEMIIGAFAAADVDALRGLLAPDALANFTSAIQARKAARQTMTTTLVSIDAADFVDARVAGGIATIAVRFAAKLASATLDASGAVVDGSTTSVVDHLDIWTFTRRLGSRDPNWQLSATETVH